MISELASVVTPALPAVVQLWILRGVLQKRIQKRRQYEENAIPINQSLRFHAIGILLSGGLALAIWKNHISLPNLQGDSLGSILLQSLSRAFTEATDLALSLPAIPETFQKIIANVFTQDSPLTIIRPFATAWRQACEMASESFVRTYWPLLLPAASAFLVSTIALAGSLTKYFLPKSLGRRIPGAFRRNRVKIRGAVLSCLSSVFAHDAKNLLFNRNDITTSSLLLSQFLGLVSLVFFLFAVEDFQVVESATSFITPALLFLFGTMALTSQSSSTTITKLAAVICFTSSWATAVSSKLLPEGLKILPQLIGFAAFPVSTSLLTRSDDPSGMSKVYGGVGILTSLICLVAPKQFVYSLEDWSFQIVDYGFSQLPKRILDVIGSWLIKPIVRSWRYTIWPFIKRQTAYLRNKTLRTLSFCRNQVVAPMWSKTKRALESVRAFISDYILLPLYHVWTEYVIGSAVYIFRHFVLPMSRFAWDLIRKTLQGLGRMIFRVGELVQGIIKRIGLALLKAGKYAWNMLKLLGEISIHTGETWVWIPLKRLFMFFYEEIIYPLYEVLVDWQSMARTLTIRSAQFVWTRVLVPIWTSGFDTITFIVPFVPLAFCFPITMQLFDKSQALPGGEPISDRSLIGLLGLSMVHCVLQYMSSILLTKTRKSDVSSPSDRARSNWTLLDSLREWLFFLGFFAMQIFHWYHFLTFGYRERMFFGFPSFLVTRSASTTATQASQSPSDPSMFVFSIMFHLFFHTFDSLASERQQYFPRTNARSTAEYLDAPLKEFVISTIDMTLLGFACSSLVDQCFMNWTHYFTLSEGKGLHYPSVYGVIRTLVICQHALSLARYHLRRLRSRPRSERLIRFGSHRWIGMVGILILCLGVSIFPLSPLLSMARSPLSTAEGGGNVIVQTLVSLFLGSMGLNCIGIQWRSLRHFRKAWTMMNWLGSRLFLICQPLLALKFASITGGAALEQVQSPQDVMGSASMSLLAFIGFAICSYSFVTISIYMGGDVLQWTPLSLFGRNMFDKIGLLVYAFGAIAGMIWDTTRFMGHFLKSLGENLLKFSVQLWRRIAVPILSFMKRAVAYVWSHALLSWVSSACLVFTLYQANRLGYDDFILQFLRENAWNFVKSWTVDVIRAFGHAISQLLIHRIPGSVSSTDEHDSASASDKQFDIFDLTIKPARLVALIVKHGLGQWIQDLENGYLLKSPSFAWFCAVFFVCASYLKIHRRVHRPFAERRRIFFVPIFSVSLCIAFAPRFTLVVFGLTILWSVLAFVQQWADEGARIRAEDALRQFRRQQFPPHQQHITRSVHRASSQRTNPPHPVADIFWGNPFRSSTNEERFFDTGQEGGGSILEDLPDESTIPQIFEAEECIICLEKIDANDNNKDGGGAGVNASRSIATLVCGHQFHRDCLGKWLQEQERCPICREPITRRGQIIQALF